MPLIFINTKCACKLKN